MEERFETLRPIANECMKNDVQRDQLKGEEPLLLVFLTLNSKHLLGCLCQCSLLSIVVLLFILDPKFLQSRDYVHRGCSEPYVLECPRPGCGSRNTLLNEGADMPHPSINI